MSAYKVTDVTPRHSETKSVTDVTRVTPDVTVTKHVTDVSGAADTRREGRSTSTSPSPSSGPGPPEQPYGLPEGPLEWP